MVNNPPANVGDIRDTSSVLGWGRSPGEGHGNSFQDSCLENPMNRGAWRATIHRVTKSQTEATLHACKQGVLDSKPLSPEVLIYIYWGRVQ